MKKLLLLSALLGSSSAMSFEMDLVRFRCPELDFTLNLSTNTATFHDIEFFGVAEMIPDTPLGFRWKGNSIRAEYNWYYTTVIDIDFPKKMYQMEIGSSVDLLINYDDNDGIWKEDVTLACKVL